MAWGLEGEKIRALELYLLTPWLLKNKNRSLYLGVKRYLAKNANWGHLQDRIGIWMCWFLRRGENRSTRRKTSRSEDENQQQTQPTYDTGTGSRTRATLVGGERSHHCAIPAPQIQHFLVSLQVEKVFGLLAPQ